MLPRRHVAEPPVADQNDVVGAVPAPLARLRRAPRLRGAVREAVVEIVRKEKDGAKERVADLVACELQHINTRHPDFVAALSDVTVRLGCLSAPSADFSDDDIEDRRIEEEEDLEDASPAAEPEAAGLVRRAARRLRDAAAAVESPRVLRAEGPAEAATLPEAAESESGSVARRRGQGVSAGLLLRRAEDVLRPDDVVPRLDRDEPTSCMTKRRFPHRSRRRCKLH